MLGSDGSLLVAQLSAQTTSPKKPVRAIISRVPKPRVTPYRADQVLAISDFEQSPSDGFDELGAEVWCV